MAPLYAIIFIISLMCWGVAFLYMLETNGIWKKIKIFFIAGLLHHLLIIFLGIIAGLTTKLISYLL